MNIKPNGGLKEQKVNKGTNHEQFENKPGIVLQKCHCQAKTAWIGNKVWGNGNGGGTNGEECGKDVTVGEESDTSRPLGIDGISPCGTVSLQI